MLEWIFKFELARTFGLPMQRKPLIFNYLESTKNIFKKMAKIPPGELQECAFVVKGWDETEFISCQ